MYVLVLLNLILILSVSQCRVLQRIVNGSDAVTGEFPYMASVRYYDKHECGGSLISNKWVLTAGHCIYSNFINVSSVLIGSAELQNGKNPLHYSIPVKRAIIHENYIPSGGFDNDIGLLELEELVTFNAYIQPVTLPRSHEPTPAGAVANLTGWGYPNDVGDVFDVLQVVQIKVYSDEYCVQTHNGKTNPEVHICAGVDEGGKGQCTGDSGGPLTVNGVQYGIVSWSQKPCTSKGYPGVFTKVATYIDWITIQTGIIF